MGKLVHLNSVAFHPINVKLHFSNRYLWRSEGLNSKIRITTKFLKDCLSAPKSNQYKVV